MARKTVKCQQCGAKAEAEVVPDGFEDTPSSFTLAITCSGHCKKVYMPLTPERMHELTGLPIDGWPR